MKTSLCSLSVSEESGSEICREYPDNPSEGGNGEMGESGSERDGEGGGDCARYSVMSYMVDEILRLGDTHISVLLRMVLESWMFFRAVSIRSISFTLRSN